LSIWVCMYLRTYVPVHMYVLSKCECNWINRKVFCRNSLCWKQELAFALLLSETWNLNCKIVPTLILWSCYMLLNTQLRKMAMLMRFCLWENNVPLFFGGGRGIFGWALLNKDEVALRFHKNTFFTFFMFSSVQFRETSAFAGDDNLAPNVARKSRTAPFVQPNPSCPRKKPFWYFFPFL
jgi:hypothetical protein